MSGAGVACLRLRERGKKQLANSAYPMAMPGFELRTPDKRVERVITTPSAHVGCIRILKYEEISALTSERRDWFADSIGISAGFFLKSRRTSNGKFHEVHVAVLRRGKRSGRSGPSKLHETGLWQDVYVPNTRHWGRKTRPLRHADVSESVPSDPLQAGHQRKR
ncbi:hypothetical protein T265_12013 [Opisthorchis viverrini]|uniref:Uncharacterized protein n=1 Tax=Opisthorchis viverrini TaxID=6198 RepID=A0A074YWN9_OPIVI|nr:hypothetical protein T265_12013 [Opisthorchis viverrini]KER19093.1 hypothetical protein T265_12013 [Opisthorchis viverrini]